MITRRTVHPPSTDYNRPGYRQLSESEVRRFRKPRHDTPEWWRFLELSMKEEDYTEEEEIELKTLRKIFAPCKDPSKKLIALFPDGRTVCADSITALARELKADPQTLKYVYQHQSPVKANRLIGLRVFDPQNFNPDRDYSIDTIWQVLQSKKVSVNGLVEVFPKHEQFIRELHAEIKEERNGRSQEA